MILTKNLITTGAMFNPDDFAEFEELPEFANEENRVLHTHVKDM
jgi:hypothetical protein